jgi:hypothetical protein
MTKMPDAIDPTELLAAANPSTDYQIEPDRFEKMISRVTSARVASRFSLLRTWQIKAGSAGAAALVVAGVVVSLGGAPAGLTVLSLANGTSVAGASPSAALTAGAAIYESTKAPSSHSKALSFVAGPQLTTEAPSKAVYSAVSVADPSASVLGVASALGISITSQSESCSYNSAGTNSASINAVGKSAEVVGTSLLDSKCQTTSGTPISWTYSLKKSPCQQSTTPTATETICQVSGKFVEHGASHLQLTTWSAPLVTSLIGAHLIPKGMTLGAPTFSSDVNIIFYPLRTSSGVVTNLDEEFQFTNHGSLLFATGLLAAISLDKTYPVLSEAGGAKLLATLTATASGAVNPGGPMIPAPITATTVQVNPGGPKIPTPTTPVTSHKTALTVTLQSATLTYELVGLANGADVLVPQYVYRASNGTTLQALALNPSCYHLASKK